MITIRKATERGGADHGWLQAQHSFSFGGYHDPDHMGFRSLRVLNEDRIAPGAGFPSHPHRDMEILTYLIQGELEHRDSMGNGSIIGPGEFQLMSAGTGVLHSEANPSPTQETHLLQIWLKPSEFGLSPGYAQERFEDRHNQLREVVSPSGRDGALKIHQDVQIYTAILDADTQQEHALAEGRHAWIQVIRGELDVNGELLGQGDGVAISETPLLSLTARQETEFLLFDLA